MFLGIYFGLGFLQGGSCVWGSQATTGYSMLEATFTEVAGLYHSRSHFHRSRRGPAHGVVTLANEASNTMGRGLGRQTSYLLMNVTGI